MQEIEIDLRLGPDKRWQLSSSLADQARLLIRSYLRDLGGATQFEPMLQEIRRSVRPEYFEEIEALAGSLEMPVHEVLFANVYYDLVKLVVGCTAFAVDSPERPLLGRNLFTVVGWPGFVGAFSGLAPGRFAVTMNAVLSEEPPRIGTPVGFLLRNALEPQTVAMPKPSSDSRI